MTPGAKWRRIAATENQVTDAQLVGDRLYVMAHRAAPRYKLLALDAATGDLAHATVVVPARDRVLQGMAIAKDAIYLQDLDGGIGKVRRLDPTTGKTTDVALPEGSAFGVAADARAPGAVLGVNSWLTPDRFYAVSAGAATPLPLARWLQRSPRRPLPARQDGRGPPGGDQQRAAGPLAGRLRRGHGMGSTRSQRERELAEQMAFLYWQIGRPAYQPR